MIVVAVFKWPKQKPVYSAEGISFSHRNWWRIFLLRSV